MESFYIVLAICGTVMLSMIAAAMAGADKAAVTDASDPG